MSTGIGRGVAIAHGKTNAVEKTTVALGVSKEGIPFGSPDGDPVHFLFLVAQPPREQKEYLLILSAIAKMVVNEKLQNDILTSISPEDIDEKIALTLNRCLCDVNKEKNAERETLLVQTN